MKDWGRGRAPPRPTPWRRFRLGARSIVDRRVAAIVLRPVRSVSAPAARADGGVGGGKGRVSAIPPRAHRACGVYGCLWEYIMEALSLGVRARVRLNRPRIRPLGGFARHRCGWRQDARRGRRSMGRTSRENRTVTEPTGSTGVPASPNILFSQPRRHAPAPGQCSELDACATARTAGAKSPNLPRLENARRGAVGSANPIASASTASGSVPLKRELDFVESVSAGVVQGSSNRG